MRHLVTLSIVFMFSVAALSGCAGKKNSDGGGEPSAADAAKTAYDRAIGNDGHRVKGTLASKGEHLGEASAVQLDILDASEHDGPETQDKATLLLDIKESGMDVQAQLFSMASGADAMSTADHHGGAARNIQVFGGTGIGPSSLPATTAYLFAAGIAKVSIGGGPTTKHLVYVAVTPALHDEGGAALSAPGESDLQMEVIFPGSTMANVAPIAEAPDGFLYYYFETVGLFKLGDGDKAKIGDKLSKPEKANLLPDAAGVVTIDGKVVSTATQEQVSNRSATVTFDGSGSKDPDGSIVRWVWRVFEFTANSTYEKPKDDLPVVQGEKVKYNFTKAGPKLINLTVSDSQGAIDTVVLNFYVDFHSKVPGKGSVHSQAPVALNSCQDTINCFQHTTNILPGFVSGTYTAKDNGTMTSGFHVDIYPMGKDVGGGNPLKSSAVDQPLTITWDDLKASGPGLYNIRVWYGTSGSAGGSDDMATTNDGVYTFETKNVYTPKV